MRKETKNQWFQRVLSEAMDDPIFWRNHSDIDERKNLSNTIDFLTKKSIHLPMEEQSKISDLIENLSLARSYGLATIRLMTDYPNGCQVWIESSMRHGVPNDLWETGVVIGIDETRNVISVLHNNTNTVKHLSPQDILRIPNSELKENINSYENTISILEKEIKKIDQELIDLKEEKFAINESFSNTHVPYTTKPFRNSKIRTLEDRRNQIERKIYFEKLSSKQEDPVLKKEDSFLIMDFKTKSKRFNTLQEAAKFLLSLIERQGYFEDFNLVSDGHLYGNFSKGDNLIYSHWESSDGLKSRDLKLSEVFQINNFLKEHFNKNADFEIPKNLFKKEEIEYYDDTVSVALAEAITTFTAASLDEALEFTDFLLENYSDRNVKNLLQEESISDELKRIVEEAFTRFNAINGKEPSIPNLIESISLVLENKVLKKISHNVPIRINARRKSEYTPSFMKRRLKNAKIKQLEKQEIGKKDSEKSEKSKISAKLNESDKEKINQLVHIARKARMVAERLNGQVHPDKKNQDKVPVSSHRAMVRQMAVSCHDVYTFFLLNHNQIWSPAEIRLTETVNGCDNYMLSEKQDPDYSESGEERRKTYSVSVLSPSMVVSKASDGEFSLAILKTTIEKLDKVERAAISCKNSDYSLSSISRVGIACSELFKYLDSHDVRDEPWGVVRRKD